MLLAVLVLGCMFEIVGCLTFVLALSSINAASKPSVSYEDRGAAMQHQNIEHPASESEYGLQKKHDVSIAASYLGTVATPISVTKW